MMQNAARTGENIDKVLVSMTALSQEVADSKMKMTSMTMSVGRVPIAPVSEGVSESVAVASSVAPVAPAPPVGALHSGGTNRDAVLPVTSGMDTEIQEPSARDARRKPGDRIVGEIDAAKSFLANPVWVSARHGHHSEDDPSWDELWSTSHTRNVRACLDLNSQEASAGYPEVAHIPLIDDAFTEWFEDHGWIKGDGFISKGDWRSLKTSSMGAEETRSTITPMAGLMPDTRSNSSILSDSVMSMYTAGGQKRTLDVDFRNSSGLSGTKMKVAPGEDLRGLAIRLEALMGQRGAGPEMAGPAIRRRGEEDR